MTSLLFGTAGIRALMGSGEGQLNNDTIQLATEGLARYLLEQVEAPCVVIGFDSRHHSAEFALTTAETLASWGIRALLLDALRPTPYLSFACRHLRASAGVMITASHNPKEYNGYKVYWSDGAQVIAPHDQGILDAMRARIEKKRSSSTHPLIERLSTHALDPAYLTALLPARLYPKAQGTLRIVYTSLHGTGHTLVPQALASWGFHEVSLVSAQCIPDGNFPTAPSPNPEQPAALKLCTEQMLREGADLALATDPDADRIGVVVAHKGKALALSGNEIAALCAEFICQTGATGMIVTTLVTTQLLKLIAARYGVTFIEVLTGFKYIGQQISLHPEIPFLFGAEESYGYLVGTHARDKDGVVMACLIAEMALHAKAEGLTLIDKRRQLYETYGEYQEKQLSWELSLQEKAALMQKLRQSPPHRLGQCAVMESKDYLNETPPADVLLLHMEGGARLIIRPSGTEPKVKIYGSLAGRGDLQALLNALRTYATTSSP